MTPHHRYRSGTGARPLCLVIPPSEFLLDERVFVSLGILKVAAVLEAAGHTVELLDLSGIENFVEVAELHARNSRARVFAFTTTTPQLPAAVRIAESVRSVRHDVHLIVGGPHVTLVHSAVKLEKCKERIGRAHQALDRLKQVFDVLVSGDGEFAVFRALDAPARTVIDADDPSNGMFVSNRQYDAMPFPARHLVDISSYRYTIDGHPATSIVAQLGCPFGCGFCGGRNTRSLRNIRVRSTASILREIEELHREYGFTAFMFYDDELNVSRSMSELMNGIADLQSRLGVDFHLRGFVKAELLTDGQVAAMVRAGFRWVLCGFEAGHERILANINKGATLDDNTRAMEMAHRHGLKVKALMSVGHPGESEETVRALHQWLVANRPDDFDCTVITTYPGTPYYDEAVPHARLPDVWTYTCRSGDRLHAREVDFSQVAEYYKGNPDGGYQAFVFTDFLSSERLVELRDWVERDVRNQLGISFHRGKAALRYEHSMGQIGLPPFLYRATPQGRAEATAPNQSGQWKRAVG